MFFLQKNWSIEEYKNLSVEPFILLLNIQYSEMDPVNSGWFCLPYAREMTTFLNRPPSQK